MSTLIIKVYMRLGLLVTLLTLTACSTGKVIFNQGKMRQQLNGGEQITDASIKQRLEAKPQLTPGFRLAIHIANPEEKWGGMPWTIEERARIINLAKNSCGPKFCKDVVEITAIEGDGDKLFVRQAAAERGAQAVLWVRGVQDVQVRDNGRAWTNLLILPAFFIGSEDIYSYFLASAQWLDVKNGYMYSDLQAVGRAKTKQALSQNESKNMLKMSRKQALDLLLPELEKSFKNFQKK